MIILVDDIIIKVIEMIYFLVIIIDFIIIKYLF